MCVRNLEKWWVKHGTFANKEHASSLFLMIYEPITIISRQMLVSDYSFTTHSQSPQQTSSLSLPCLQSNIPPYPTNQLTVVFCNNYLRYNCHPQQILPIKHVCKSKEISKSNSLVREGDLSKWVRPEYTINCGEINGGAKPFWLSFSVTAWTAFLRHYEPASELVSYYAITNQRH